LTEIAASCTAAYSVLVNELAAIQRVGTSFDQKFCGKSLVGALPLKEMAESVGLKTAPFKKPHKTAVRVTSLSLVVFIRYCEFNSRFVHGVHEVLDFSRVHGSTKRRERHHQHQEYLQPFAFHRHEFLPAVDGKSSESAGGRNSPRKRCRVVWN
jgi:hypothetical protein